MLVVAMSASHKENWMIEACLELVLKMEMNPEEEACSELGLKMVALVAPWQTMHQKVD